MITSFKDFWSKKIILYSFSWKTAKKKWTQRKGEKGKGGKGARQKSKIHKGEEVTRKELMDTLNLDMTDEVLEGKLDALVKSDIIGHGVSNFRYHAVADNIFDKVFRGVYQDEIEHFDVGQIKKEYGQSFEKLKRQYRKLQGKYSYQKGYFAEYLILNHLRLHAREKNEFLKSITRYLPEERDCLQ